MSSEYSTNFIAKDSLRPDKLKENQLLFEAIFKIHHITRKEFNTSLAFYESRPDLNKRVFDSLVVYAARINTEHNKPSAAKPGQALPK